MNREEIRKIVFTAYLILLIYKLVNTTLLFQQTHPPLLYPNLNFGYWLFLTLNIQNYIFDNVFFKYFIDLLLFSSCILSIVKTKDTIYPIVFSVSIWLYQFLYFSIIAYQPFTIGLLFPCLPFIFTNELKFNIAFNFGRYFFLGLYFFGGILKVLNGAVFNIFQLSNSIKISCADFMLFNPNHFKTHIMHFLIENVELSYLLFLGATVLEISFILGFFTKRYDLYLALLFLLFHFTNYIILDLPFSNHAIILLFLIPIKNNRTYLK